MTTKELEKQIVRAIKEESKITLASDVGYLALIKLVKKLFTEYRGEKKYITATINGILKGDK
jgi:hypothetical protein